MHRLRRKSVRKMELQAALPKTQLELLESRQLLSASPLLLAQPAKTVNPNIATASIDGFTPAQIRQAYGFDQVTFGSGQTIADGSGQTIAIVDAFDAPTVLADLRVFDKQFGIADPPKFTKESQTGSTKALPTVDAGWAQEAALDVEWAHAIAPGANILLVEANSDSVKDLMAAVDTARRAPGVTVVSMSWGMDEFSNESSYDKIFSSPKGHVGVTFVAASGDDGAGRATWPAMSANVLAVGGTTLSLNSSGNYGSETAWRDSSGGTSRFESAPAYQSSVQTGSQRIAPDVSYDANPDTGFAIYDSLSYQHDAGWQVFGGTSAGTPQWGALVAIANQGRVLQGGKSLGGPTGTLPALYSLYTPSGTYAASYHDITTGGGFGGGGFGFRRRFGQSSTAKVGYDTVTGLGTPEAQTVITALIGAKAAAKPKTSATSSTTSKTTAKAALVKASSVVNVAAMKMEFSAVPVHQVITDVVFNSSIGSTSNAVLLVGNVFSGLAQWRPLDSYAGLDASSDNSPVARANPSASTAQGAKISALDQSELNVPDRSWRFFLFSRKITIRWRMPQLSDLLDAPATIAEPTASSTWIRRLTLMLATGVAIGTAAFRRRRQGQTHRGVGTRPFSIFDF